MHRLIDLPPVSSTFYLHEIDEYISNPFKLGILLGILFYSHLTRINLTKIKEPETIEQHRHLISLINELIMQLEKVSELADFTIKLPNWLIQKAQTLPSPLLLMNFFSTFITQLSPNDIVYKYQGIVAKLQEMNTTRVEIDQTIITWLTDNAANIAKIEYLKSLNLSLWIQDEVLPSFVKRLTSLNTMSAWGPADDFTSK